MKEFISALLITVFTVGGCTLGFFIIISNNDLADIGHLGFSLGSALISALVGAVIGLAFGIGVIFLLRAIFKFFQRREVSVESG